MIVNIYCTITGFYTVSENRILPDFSMIYGGQFHNGDGTDDALWCQSANNGFNIGLWYYPNGAQVPLFMETLVTVYHVQYSLRGLQVRLH